jgi:putative YhbY family RNA-binding protein
MKDLNPAQRRALRARAHHLHPVVALSQNGLSDAVLAEIERSLKAHELIKVRVYGEDREARNALMERICGALDAAPVQHIGNILVIYRENPEPETEPRPAPPRPRPRRAAPAAARPRRRINRAA